MATYDIDKITLPNGDVCNLRNSGLVASSNTIVNSGPYINPPRRFSGENLHPECWWMNSATNFNYELFNDDGVIEITATADAEFQLCKPYMYGGDIYDGWDAPDWHDGDKGVLSCDIKSSSPIRWRMGFFLKNSSLGNISLVPTASVASTYDCTQWTRVYYSFTIPSGWDTAFVDSATERVYINFSGLLATGQTMYMRNAMLSHGVTITAYSPSSADAILVRGSKLPVYGTYTGDFTTGTYTTPSIEFYQQNEWKSQLSGKILNTRRNLGDGVSAPGRIQFRQFSWDSTNSAALDNYEGYTFPQTDDNRTDNITYDILTTKNVTVDEWTKNDFSISNMTTSSTNIYGTTIYITGVCDITVLNLSGPISGSWSWGTEKTIFTIKSSLSSSNPKKYNAFYGGSAQAAASYGTNGSATFYKHGNGTTIGCSISANPASGQYVQGQIVLVHLYS